MYVILLTTVLLGAEAEKENEKAKLAEHPTIVKMHEEALRLRGGRQIELDEECCRIAQRWANQMARTRYFRHGGGEQIIAQGYPTIKACFAGWMGSSGHRRWVLSKSDKCGWGFQRSSTGHCYWVGVFRNEKRKKSSG
jgi:uncharacterized protein YkwD